MESTNQKDYSLKYKELLLKFVSKSEEHSRLNLEDLVKSKIDELSQESESNFEKSIQKFILDLSLYFINENTFVSEEYFSLIDNKIYKIFYEFLDNPTEPQYSKFLESFFDLDYGASTIFLICTQLCKNKKFGLIPFDLFFRIIIKKNRDKLQLALGEDFPLDENHEKIIQRLACFAKIRNKIEVGNSDLLDLFKNHNKYYIENNTIKELDNNKKSYIISNNINIKESTEKGTDKKIQLNKELNRENKNQETKNIHKPKKKNKSKEYQKNFKEIEKKPEEENIDNLNEENNNKINVQNTDEDKDKKNKIENDANYIKEENKFFKHLVKMKEKYKKLRYKTPVLDYLIKNDIKLKEYYFKYTKNKEIIIDHLYDNLLKLIICVNLNIIDFEDEKYGYFCYYFLENNKKKYVESIFSLVDLNLLSDRISSDLNFPKDNFKSPDKSIAKNVFKSRSLSFEYFINNNILIKKYNIKEKARVIYSFKSLDDIESINNNNIINNQSIEKGLEELDGVIFEDYDLLLNLDKSCFMIDIPYKFRVVSGTDKKKSIQEYESNQINDNTTVEIKKNTLTLLEIKNQFPPYEESKESKENEKKPSNFYHITKGLIRKTKIFKQIYEQKYSIGNINIKLILFYDVIQKQNYYDELKRAVYDSFKKNDKELFNFEFQCIYIKASYLTGGLININDTVDNLKSELSLLNKKYDALNNKFDILTNFIFSLNLPKDKLDAFSNIINK